MDLVVVFHLLLQADASRATNLHDPKRTLSPRRELMQAFLGKYASEHQIVHLELPIMHKSLVIAPERLAVPCISESYLSSCFIDQVNIIKSELILHSFVIHLDTGGDHGDLWGDNSFSPIHKE
jgi:hypothetical protein